MSDDAEWLVDLGHSRAKWALSRGGNLLEQSVAACPVEQLQALVKCLTAQPAPVWLSAQSNPENVNFINDLCRQTGVSLRLVSLGDPVLPVVPAYSTLGCDRWLALQWPRQKAAGAFCVIDCGTAVTVDLVDEHGQHQGGWILSGWRLLLEGLPARARVLAAHSSRETDAIPDDETPAMDTASALLGGALLQLRGGVMACLAAIERASGQRPALWLTGGDAQLLEPALNQAEPAWPVTIDPHLVLRGLGLATRT